MFTGLRIIVLVAVTATPSLNYNFASRKSPTSAAGDDAVPGMNIVWGDVIA